MKESCRKAFARTVHAMKMLASCLSVAFCLSVSGWAQSLITWNVTDIVDETDVSTRGEPCIAVNLGPEVQELVINTVTFQADRGHWTRKIMTVGGSPSSAGVMYWPDFSSGGFVLQVPYCRAANVGVGNPGDPSYDELLRRARHGHISSCPTITCTVDGLTPGHVYEIQLFASNNRTDRVSEWDNGLGGRGAANGGIFLVYTGPTGGQVATGTFVADASGAQSFTTYNVPASGTNPEVHASLNGIQLRDLTPQAGDARATHYGLGTPGTQRQPYYGGTNHSPGIQLEGGHPVMGTNVVLTAENSFGAPTSALVIGGFTDFTAGGSSSGLPLLGGYLLTDALVTISASMPFAALTPGAPYTTDHELRVPFALPLARGTFYVQVLQLDAGAPQGISLTQGMKITLGI